MLHNTFKDFQDYLRTIWIPKHQNAVQLDGSLIQSNNPAVFEEFYLNDVPELKGIKISLHGGCEVTALRKLCANGVDVNCFIIIPPQSQFKKWRFHFKETHNYSQDTSADGFYAYLS